MLHKIAAAVAALPVAVAQPIDCTFSSSYPRQYVAYKTNHSLVIDGRLDDPAWLEVGFTEPFVDISTNTTPKFLTHAKIRWDDKYLYVGGHLEDTAAWANITTTCHCINPNEDQVIFHDNDFEVFVDPDGSTHYYKETEVNAANAPPNNATWDLCLNAPYDDGGYENSTRVYGAAGFDMAPRLLVRSYTDGTLNDPTVPHSFWSVELALPLADLAYNTSAAPPVNGSFWRINFSRVEWAVTVVNGRYIKTPSCQSCPTPGAPVEDNWVWSPQGSIAMHLPEKWGFLQFSSDAPNTTAAVRNAEWPVRSVAMALYYAQHAFAGANNGSFTANVTALAPFAPPHVLDGTCTQTPVVSLAPDARSFNGTVVTADGGMTATIRNDRYLRVTYAQ